VRYLVDSFSPKEIEYVLQYYPAEGVTTNPTIVCRERADFRETLLAIRHVVGEGILHVETMQTRAEDMLREALALQDLLSRRPGDLFIKLPAVPEGIRACRMLKNEGLGVTVTAVFSPQQALVAARAGADFAAPYVNKLSDVGDGEACVKRIAQLYQAHGLTTKILSASFRNVEQVTRVAEAGSHYATLPPAFFDKLVYHPMTELAVKGFEADWREVYGDKAPIELI
jgi:Transaldolase